MGIPIFNKKVRAFTLAEVLITLGIIGVVAALTLPTLMTKIQEQSTVGKLRKSYNSIENAYQRMISDYGPLDTWDITGYNDADYYEKNEDGTFKLDASGNRIVGQKGQDSSTLFSKRLTSYLKVIDGCYDYSCAREISEYYMDGVVKNEKFRDRSTVLADGIGISSIWIGDSQCKLSYGSSKALQHICGDMYVILKPRTRKRISGVDFFGFYITKYGIVPFSMPQYSHEQQRMAGCVSKRGWGACTGWVIYKGNMDYLRCSDLSWEGKDKCK